MPSCGGSLKSSNDPDHSSCEKNVGQKINSSITRKCAQSNFEARPDLLNAKMPTYEQFVSKKSEEWRGHFKPKAPKHLLAMAKKEATINISFMGYVVKEEGDV